MQMTAKRVLVIYTGHLGDLIMATPIIAHLRATYGFDTKIDWLARKPFGELLKADKRIHQAYSIKHMKLPIWADLAKRRLVNQSRHKPYDLLICLNLGDATSLVDAVCAHEKIHPGDAGGKTSHHVVQEMQSYYLPFLYPNKPPELLPPTLELAHSAENKNSQQPYIVISATTSKFKSKSARRLKNWPAEHWCKLIELLLENYAGNIVIPHAAGEKSHIRAMLSAIQNPRLTTCSPSLLTLCDLVSQAELVVSADTGPAHLANTLGTPTVTLFGPTNSAKTAPYINKKTRIILQGPTDQADSMRAILPNTVLDAISLIVGCDANDCRV